LWHINIAKHDKWTDLIAFKKFQHIQAIIEMYQIFAYAHGLTNGLEYFVIILIIVYQYNRARDLHRFVVNAIVLFTWLTGS